MPGPMDHLPQPFVIEPKDHSPIGPSSFGRARACPPSAYLNGVFRELAVRAAGYDAAEGTVAHYVFERCVADPKRRLSPLDFIGYAFHADGFDITFDIMQADPLHAAVRFCRELMANSGRVEVERRLVMPGSRMFGHADVIIYPRSGRGPIAVVDLKFGVGVKVSPDTPQLGLYGLMALAADADGDIQAVLADPPGARNAGEDILIRAYIIQPRSTDSRPIDMTKQPTPIDPNYHEWSRADLRELYADVLRVDKYVDTLTLPYQIGTHCQFCDAKLMCPQLELAASDPAMLGLTADPGEGADREVRRGEAGGAS